jgi:hypothetical protein
VRAARPEPRGRRSVCGEDLGLVVGHVVGLAGAQAERLPGCGQPVPVGAGDRGLDDRLLTRVEPRPPEPSLAMADGQPLDDERGRGPELLDAEATALDADASRASPGRRGS